MVSQTKRKLFTGRSLPGELSWNLTSDAKLSNPHALFRAPWASFFLAGLVSKPLAEISRTSSAEKWVSWRLNST